MSKLAIVAATLLAVFGRGQPVFADEAISEPRCVCGLSTGAGVLSAGHPIFYDLANASANEHGSRVEGHARTPQSLSRHHRHSSAAGARPTAHVVIARERTPWI